MAKWIVARCHALGRQADVAAILRRFHVLANDDLDDILGDGWDDESPTGKASVSPPPRSLSSLSGAVSPGEDSDDDFFASLGMESKPAFSKGRSFRK